METLLLVALAAYLIGSIPFGLILTRLAGLGDIRNIGSGNIGATNVLRTGNKWLALATLALDFGKAFVPLIAWWSFTGAYECDEVIKIQGKCSSASYPSSFILPAFIILGHMFPIWLKFKGGKGVACIFGLTYALSWEAGLMISAGWLLLFFTTRYSSLGAMIGIPLGMVAAILSDHFPLWVAMVLPILLMVAKHHENIRRLLKGEEHRFSFKKKESRE